MTKNQGVRFFHLATYDSLGQPSFMAGNVFLGQAEPSVLEKDPVTDPKVEPGYKLIEKEDGWYVQLAFNKTWLDLKRSLVTSEMLGIAKNPNLPFEQPDGSPYQLGTDYLGEKRNSDNPAPGPFVIPKTAYQWIKVWPKDSEQMEHL